jgi:hypothetical protein
MFSTIRKRLTYANVVLTVALVFAMSGGAYAASKYVITSTKQISPKVLKSLKGANGAQGPVGEKGLAGPEGKAGIAGTTGPTGAPGANGVSVTSKQLTTSEAACAKAGGSEFTAAEGKKTTACNGSPWTAGGTLPEGATETGQWILFDNGQAKEPQVTSISFSVPLHAPLDAADVHFIAEGATPPTGCAGTLEKPQAANGNLCVFTKTLANLVPGFAELALTSPIIDQIAGGPGAGTTGTSLVFEVETTGLVIGGGTWAVTG